MNESRQRILVTGAAGFVGSHLCERLVADGHDVVGVDCFTDYYAREIKEANLERLFQDERFSLREIDLSRAPLDPILEGVEVVYHLAAQAGVRGSFGDSFETYVRNNIQATQRLLEAASRRALDAFVYASSSSVYGNAADYPTREDAPLRPMSPYGVTKQATESIAGVYHRNHGVPVVGMRYFTAYGPRQRPDMAFHRFLRRALAGEPITILGDGCQLRDFTFVGDVVRATMSAAALGQRGSVYNIGCGEPVDLLTVIALLEELVERPVDVRFTPAATGDPRQTFADNSRAQRELEFEPTTSVADGLAAELDWMLSPRQAELLAA